MVGARAIGSTATLAVAFWCGALVWAPDISQATAAERPESQQQQRDLEHLLDGVLEERLDLAHRRRAATILLDRGWPAAADALYHHLTEAQETSTRRAIAQAVAEAEAPPARFVDPLMALLASEEELLRRDAAAALGRFAGRAEAPTQQLLRIARNDGLDGEAASLRIGAIEALGEQRSREVAAALLEIAAETEGAAREAALVALGRLTGLRRLGQDLRAWKSWWEQARDLPEPRWWAMLLRELSARNAELATELEAARERVVGSYNRLYDAASEEERADILARMLDDPMAELRLRALQLIDRRLLNAQAIDEPVRSAMRNGLDDADPRVRSRSARLLENLADSEAATRIVERLLVEPDPEVRRQFLALLTRVPQAEAVGHAMSLLEMPADQAPAARFLRKAVEAGLVTTPQRHRALRLVRSQVERDNPEPEVVRLLGRLGGAEDRPRIEALLEADDEPLRVAAARAWAQLDGSVEGLLDRLDASRPQTVRRTLLRAVAESEGDATLRIEAWLRLGLLEREAGRIDEAMEIYGRLDGMEDGFEENQAQRFADDLLGLLLQNGELEQAAAFTRRWLGKMDGTAVAMRLKERWVEAVEDVRDAAEPRRARQLTELADELFPDRLEEGSAGRLAELRRVAKEEMGSEASDETDMAETSTP